MNEVVILVPTYQCEATIAETLNSILKQGSALDRVSEVIIADDASKDRTRQVARQVWKSSTPIKVLEAAENRGEYVNVNEAVAGFPPGLVWFLIMHGDNVAKEGWLETLLNRLAKASERVGAIGSSWDYWKLNGTTIPGEDALTRDVEEIPGTTEAVRGTLRKGCWWHISSCAIRVAAYKQVGGLPNGLRLKGDWDFMLRLLGAGWSIEYIPRTLLLYRENPGGSSSLTFRLHKDIKETLQVVRWHQQALSPSRAFSLHAFYVWMLARRCGGSLVRFDFRRLLAAFPAGLDVVASFLKCLFRISEPRPTSTSMSIGASA